MRSECAGEHVLQLLSRPVHYVKEKVKIQIGIQMMAKSFLPSLLRPAQLTAPWSPRIGISSWILSNKPEVM